MHELSFVRGQFLLPMHSVRTECPLLEGMRICSLFFYTCNQYLLAECSFWQDDALRAQHSLRAGQDLCGHTAFEHVSNVVMD